MKNITVQVFVTLGVIFLVLLVVGIYLFVTDPYGLKPLLQGGSSPMQSNDAPVSSEQENSETSGPAEGETSGGFELSSAQVEALVSLGIDPAAVPSSVSPEQETCFIGVLGETRVEEIKAGAVPNALEFLKAKSCI